MSKQNDMQRRKAKHLAEVAKEKAEREKREKKLEKKIIKRRVAEMSASGAKKTKKAKGVRIKRNVVVKGIRIRTAEDKQKVKELLKEQADSQMDCA
mmetsp:Transcript_46186/g.88136  ORF Transcript_46186/g.88136 Transcript_46186/m.88136 type:complete len:96 (-) Transcript_46186:175-462(-)|eukprot:CAMPEP_0114245742 /NCGR_PEP_ID=MMETSP0058-20121206/12069_1 /TAXON_ID=36894 /ORGANISM="Pyramimonas parkeae, CCMP726" /LENGTH=95 /DNA_ID=CAMNT_0001358837 /DNA_START=117 /DNA_END=404 /DNA_ORIENTATION=+